MKINSCASVSVKGDATKKTVTVVVSSPKETEQLTLDREAARALAREIWRISRD